MPFESHMTVILFAPSGAGWEPWGWGGSREAMSTVGSIAECFLPHWVLLWQRNAGMGLAAGLYHDDDHDDHDHDHGRGRVERM
jgi:hypothetical protein